MLSYTDRKRDIYPRIWFKFLPSTYNKSFYSMWNVDIYTLPYSAFKIKQHAEKTIALSWEHFHKQILASKSKANIGFGLKIPSAWPNKKKLAERSFHPWSDAFNKFIFPTRKPKENAGNTQLFITIQLWALIPRPVGGGGAAGDDAAHLFDPVQGGGHPVKWGCCQDIKFVFWFIFGKMTEATGQKPPDRRRRTRRGRPTRWLRWGRIYRSSGPSSPSGLKEWKK